MTYVTYYIHSSRFKTLEIVLIHNIKFQLNDTYKLAREILMKQVP